MGLFIFQVVLGLDRNPNLTLQATLPYSITQSCSQCTEEVCRPRHGLSSPFRGLSAVCR